MHTLKLILAVSFEVRILTTEHDSPEIRWENWNFDAERRFAKISTTSASEENLLLLSDYRDIVMIFTSLKPRKRFFLWTSSELANVDDLYYLRINLYSLIQYIIKLLYINFNKGDRNLFSCITIILFEHR